MNGRRVVVIHSRYDYGCGDASFPPIGATGTIILDIDEDNEYEVDFEEYPYPSEIDPGWVTHESMIVFIDDEKAEQHEDELCLNY